MTTLHILNQSADHQTSKTCLNTAKRDDVLILIGDGVYCLVSQPAVETSVTTFALIPDLAARGISSDPATHSLQATLIDYDGFVQLTEIHTPIVSWY